MRWDYGNIRQFVSQSDIARQEIIRKCHEVGYDIPTDEMRKAAGEDPIKITEIPDWLYRFGSYWIDSHADGNLITDSDGNYLIF